MKKIGKQIIVIANGFVHVGDCELDGEFLYIHQAQNIRSWGTTRGLGELVSGPTKKTVLDPLGEVVVPISKVIFFLSIQDSSSW